MSLEQSKVVSDLRVYHARQVSTDYGRKVMEELARRGEIAPYRSPTGRHFLTFEEAEILARAL